MTTLEVVVVVFSVCVDRGNHNDDTVGKAVHHPGPIEGISNLSLSGVCRKESTTALQAQLEVSVRGVEVDDSSAWCTSSSA